MKIKLVQFVKTRWNSMYDMLDSILINKSALVAISLETDLLSPDQIPNENEFIILKEFCSILEPLIVMFRYQLFKNWSISDNF